MASSREPQQLVVAPSPNWFCSSIVSASLAGSGAAEEPALVAYGGKNSVVLLAVGGACGDGGGGGGGGIALVGTLSGHTDRVSAVAFCRQPLTAHLLLSGGKDKFVRVWDARRRVALGKMGAKHQQVRMMLLVLVLLVVLVVLVVLLRLLLRLLVSLRLVLAADRSAAHVHTGGDGGGCKPGRRGRGDELFEGELLLLLLVLLLMLLVADDELLAGRLRQAVGGGGAGAARLVGGGHRGRRRERWGRRRV